MYLSTDLGQPTQHPTQDRLQSLKTCSAMQPATCAEWTFTVPFRMDFTNFREEVRQAIGKRVTFRSDRGAFVDRNLIKFEGKIKEMHNDLASSKNESDPVRLVFIIRYPLGSKKELDFIIP